MEYRKFENTIIARIDKGEEIIEKVKEIALKEQITLASVQALGAVVSATCEMVITIINGTVDRYFDEEIGLNLFQFQ